MNTLSWLRLSLGLNGCLLALLLWSATRIPGNGEGPARVVAASATPPRPSAPSPGDERVEPVSSDEALGWSESMARLRAAGVPGAIIAKVVIEKMAQKWTPLEAEMERRYLNGETDAKALAEFHDRRALEEEAELRAALGDGFLAWDQENTVQTMYLGGLTPTEAQKAPLYALQKAYLKRLHDLQVSQRNGAIDAATFEVARAREELDYKTRLAGIIGEERVDGLQPVDHAAQIRGDFARLGLGDAQMKELAGVQKKWSDVRTDMARSLEQTRTVDGAYEGDLKALDRARDEEYRRILGDERFEAWQRAGDDRYRAMQNNAPGWNLDAAAINQVYGTLRAYDLAVANREYQAQLGQQAGQVVNWADVEAEIVGYTNQTESALRAHLGDVRFERLREAGVLGLREPDRGKIDPGARPRL